MSMVNVSLIGNLVRDPEQICFASGRVKSTMLVAVNNVIKNSNKTEDSADFYRIETWGKLAELVNKYLLKGNQVGVSGRLIMEHWTDKQGRERLTPVIAANQISLPPKSNLRISESNNSNKSNFLQKSKGEPVLFTDDDDDLLSGAKEITVSESRPIYRIANKSRNVSLK